MVRETCDSEGKRTNMNSEWKGGCKKSSLNVSQSKPLLIHYSTRFLGSIYLCMTALKCIKYRCCICICVFLFFPVLTWEGDASAISRDSIQDTRQAKYKTVIDEWDEEFDSGKVRKRPSQTLQ